MKLDQLVPARRRAAAGFLALTAIAYPIAWDADPYIFGFTVLGFLPVQLTLAGLGMLARLTRRDPHTRLTRRDPHTAAAWAVDALLVGAAIGSLAFLRTISWS